MGIPHYYRAILTTLFPLIGTLYASAYDSKDLVGSALEYEIDPKYFMMYFQDGNIITFCIGIFCAIMFVIFRKKISITLRVVCIACSLTLIVLPLLLMLLGKGYGGVVDLFILSFFLVIYGLFVTLSILLIYWIVSLIKSKNLRKSGIAVWKFIIKGFGTVPLTYIGAFGVFAFISLFAQDWNLTQCEKYVQSRWNEDFCKVPELMCDWEKAHLLQWGKSAKEYYERREHPEPCDSVLEEIIEINNATETND